MTPAHLMRIPHSHLLVPHKEMLLEKGLGQESIFCTSGPCARLPWLCPSEEQDSADAEKGKGREGLLQLRSRQGGRQVCLGTGHCFVIQPLPG